jgi:cell division protein ZapE
MEGIWRQLAGSRPERAERIALSGRDLPVSRAVGDMAWFTFRQLCEEARGAADYLAIADRYATVFVHGVPRMDRTMANQARRFILLIDTLYDRNVRLVIAADALPRSLFAGTTGREAAEFGRTASRLIEMQSDGWPERTGRSLPARAGARPAPIA